MIRTRTEQVKNNCNSSLQTDAIAAATTVAREPRGLFCFDKRLSQRWHPTISFVVHKLTNRTGYIHTPREIFVQAVQRTHFTSATSSPVLVTCSCSRLCSGSRLPTAYRRAQNTHDMTYNGIAKTCTLMCDEARQAAGPPPFALDAALLL